MLDSFLEQLATVELIDWAAMLAGIVGVYLSIKEHPTFLWALCHQPRG